MTEIYKDIPGYEGLYQASDQGNVRSIDRVDRIGRKLKGNPIKQDSNRETKLTLSERNNISNKSLSKLNTK